MAASTAIKPILRYPGGKARIADWIVSHIPPHSVYVEPYLGGGSVFFCKSPAKVEMLSDLDGRVATLFRVLRDRPDELARAVALTPYSRLEYAASDEPSDDELEAARRFLARVWMAHGGKGPTPASGARVWQGIPRRIAAVADRLRDAIIDCRPALEVIATWRHPDALIYADPPYPHAALPMTGSTTNNRRNERPRYYRHEMSAADHVALLDALDRHPGPVLSGYRCPLYDERLAGWQRLDMPALAYRQAPRTESLWLNRRVSRG